MTMLMRMANCAEMLRTSSPELHPMTLTAVAALQSLSPKTEPQVSPVNGLGALASLASLESLTPKSKAEAITQIGDSMRSGRRERGSGADAKRTRRPAKKQRTQVISSKREREREAAKNPEERPLALLAWELPEYKDVYNTEGRIGIYTPHERKTLLKRWHKKRIARSWNKIVRYDCRKSLANGRVRVKGRFVKLLPGQTVEQQTKMLLAQAAAEAQAVAAAASASATVVAAVAAAPEASVASAASTPMEPAAKEFDDIAESEEP